MLTIYNFSFHKSPQYGYDRQKKKGKTTISPLLTFNLKVGFTFSVLSILRVRVKWLIFNMVLQLWADVKYHVPTGLTPRLVAYQRMYLRISLKRFSFFI